MNTTFANPTGHFADADANTIGSLVAKAADLALIVEPDGIVRDVAGKHALLDRIGVANWRGMRLDQILGAAEAADLLALVNAPSSNTSEVTVAHPTTSGAPAMIAYTAADPGIAGQALLLGRDVTQVLSLQERLLAIYRLMEDKLESQKQVEAQYRTLFAIGSEPVLVVNATSGQVTDANRAALTMLNAELNAVSGQPLASLFAKAEQTELSALLGKIQDTNAAASIQVRLLSGTAVTVKATPSWGTDKSLLIQLHHATSGADVIGGDGNLVELIRAANEAIVLVDDSGTITWANTAFTDLAMSGTVATTQGQPLSAFFDRSELDLGTTLANLRDYKRIRMLPASLRKTTGEMVEVELSAIAIPNATSATFGFVIRNVSLRVGDPRLSNEKVASVDQIWGQIGKVPLRELVRKEIDVVEKGLIESALNLTGNNRAATAKILGLSRQSLYSKLNRFGIMSDV